MNSFTNLLILIVFCSIDWVLTYWIMLKYIIDFKVKPKKVIEIESNPIARFLIRKLGFDMGFIVSYFVSLTIIFIIFFNTSLNFYYFILGAYFTILISHIHHLRLLYKKKSRRKNSSKNK